GDRRRVAHVEGALLDGERQALALLLERLLLDRRVQHELDLVLPGEEELALPGAELGDVLAGADRRDLLLDLLTLMEEDDIELDAVLERGVSLHVDGEVRVVALRG